MKKWKIRVIHLSHTDIGYKDTQAKIIKQQTNNLYDVVKKLKKNEISKTGWKWNIESFGTVMDFVNRYPEMESELVELISEKKIGLSACYWNFSKIASSSLIGSTFKWFKDFCKKHNFKANSLISNDINGYAASWAVEAQDAGVKNLFFGLHTHHGFYPVYRKQAPFWWELPNNKKVLVWIGEQYAFGNNMGIVPGPMSDYITKDEKTAGINENEQISLANDRIKEYLGKLEDDGYMLDVVPITVLGTGADNDPANFDISERLDLIKEEWSKFGVNEVTMVTLDEFFDEVHASNATFPTYKGEWTDWWTDGVGSNPQGLRAYKEATRNYEVLKRVSNIDLSSIEKDLLLFTEHTFGTEDSIRYSHDQYNFNVEKIKSSYALNALNKSISSYGEVINWKSYRIKNNKKINIKIKNPFKTKIKKSFNISRYLGWEEKNNFLNQKTPLIKCGDKIVDYSIEVVPHPIEPAWNEKEIWVHLDFLSEESKTITVYNDGEMGKKIPMTSSFSTLTAELADDVMNINSTNKDGKISLIEDTLTSKNYEINFDENGIASIKFNGSEIIDATNCKLFQPVYVLDKVDNYNRNELFLQRRFVGKNKMTSERKVHIGKFLHKDIEISENGQDAKIVVRYEILNSKFYEVILKISNYHNRVDVKININKDPEWSMESMFIATPLNGKRTIDYDYEYEIGAGQLPGTGLDYHSTIGGMKFGDMCIAHLDSSLIWSGNFKYGTRELVGQNFGVQREIYSWILNNVWETNFSADTSGFHQFRYIISPMDSKESLSEKLAALSSDFVVERLDDEKMNN